MGKKKHGEKKMKHQLKKCREKQLGVSSKNKHRIMEINNFTKIYTVLKLKTDIQTITGIYMITTVLFITEKR
jgi:hypothetical protein